MRHVKRGHHVHSPSISSAFPDSTYQPTVAHSVPAGGGRNTVPWLGCHTGPQRATGDCVDVDGKLGDGWAAARTLCRLDPIRSSASRLAPGSRRRTDLLTMLPVIIIHRNLAGSAFIQHQSADRAPVNKLFSGEEACSGPSTLGRDEELLTKGLCNRVFCRGHAQRRTPGTTGVIFDGRVAFWVALLGLKAGGEDTSALIRYVCTECSLLTPALVCNLKHTLEDDRLRWDSGLMVMLRTVEFPTLPSLLKVSTPRAYDHVKSYTLSIRARWPCNEPAMPYPSRLPNGNRSPRGICLP